MLNKLTSWLLLGGVNTISAVERAFNLEAPGRKLTIDECAELYRVFADAIDYQQVMVKAGNSHLLSITARAFVLANTVYIPQENFSLGLLVHEMTHVWQYQRGGVQYISKALWGQFFDQGYDFARGINEGRSWAQLNPEQQAELIQQGYEAGYFHFAGVRFFFAERDYTQYLTDAVAQLRAGNGAP
jgi:hypothetical protein